MNIMRTRSRNAAAPPQPQGNLGAVLTGYDRSHQNPQESSSPAPESGALTINVPDPMKGGEDDDRERSLTLGSVDLHSIVMGKDGRGLSFSGLMTPAGGGDEHMSEGTAATHVSGSTSSTNHSAQAAPSNTDTLLPKLPEHGSTVSASIPVQTKTGAPATSRARGDSTASQFLHGLMQQPLPPAQRRGQGPLISHTPPTQMGTSYENSHFGKRIRAGVSFVTTCVYLSLISSWMHVTHAHTA